MYNNTDTASRILNCAQALLVERGYNAFSYADIAEVVHVSKATIHHHFQTKSFLVKEILVRYRANIRVMMDSMKGLVPDSFGQLKAYANFWETCIRDHTTPFCICVLLAAEIPTLPEEVRAEVQGHFRELALWLASIMEEGDRQGVIHLESPVAVEAEVFMAAIHGAMLASRAHGDWRVFASVAAEAMRRLTPATNPTQDLSTTA